MTPRVIIVYGDIGAGKTTIAEALSKKIDYVLIHFDNIMWMATGRDRIYDENDNFLLNMDEIIKVYDAMHVIAKYLLSMGKGVILESLYLQTQRENAIRIAEENRCPYCIIEVVSDEEITRQRLAKRKDSNPQSAGIKIFEEYKPKKQQERRKHMTVINHGSIEGAVENILAGLEEYTLS